MQINDGMNTIRVTLETGDVVEVAFDLKVILSRVIASAIENHSGRAIAQGGKIKATVKTRVTPSRRTLATRARIARKTEAAAADFSYVGHGSLVQLFPQTEAAKQWGNEHLPADAPRHGSSYPIEWRYFPAILEGIHNDGLTIKENR